MTGAFSNFTLRRRAPGSALLAVALFLLLALSTWAQNSSRGLPAPHAATSKAQGADVLWYRKAPPGWGGVVTNMKLLAPGVGWAERSGHLYWTEDNGASWKDITPLFAGELSDIFFLNSDMGWITINHRQPPPGEPQFDLASTTDGGATWSRSTIHLKPEDYGIASSNTPGWTMPPGWVLKGGGGPVAFAVLSMAG